MIFPSPILGEEHLRWSTSPRLSGMWGVAIIRSCWIAFHMWWHTYWTWRMCSWRKSMSEGRDFRRYENVEPGLWARSLMYRIYIFYSLPDRYQSRQQRSWIGPQPLVRHDVWYQSLVKLQSLTSCLGQLPLQPSFVSSPWSCNLRVVEVDVQFEGNGRESQQDSPQIGSKRNAASSRTPFLVSQLIISNILLQFDILIFLNARL